MDSRVSELFGGCCRPAGGGAGAALRGRGGGAPGGGGGSKAKKKNGRSRGGKANNPPYLPPEDEEASLPSSYATPAAWWPCTSKAGPTPVCLLPARPEVAVPIQAIGGTDGRCSSHCPRENCGKIKPAEEKLVTPSFVTSMRYYKENFSKDRDLSAHSRYGIYVPTGIAAFPQEILHTPRVWAKDIYKNIITYSYMPRGGHFPAFEEPKLLAQDICSLSEKWNSCETAVEIHA